MTEPHIPQAEAERAFLVAAAVRGSRPLLSIDDSLNELALLADTAGMEVVGQASQNVNQIDPSTFIGSGKLEEVRERIEDLKASVVIFDDELSPRHQREIEKRLSQDIKVMDRSVLILDIFAQHAQTREGALQVELAQYEYRLPRLTRAWTHLARQAGGSGSAAGVGLRGPGETQLEVDKREVGRRITKLKNDLEAVRRHRARHRRQREQSGIPVIAVVGYTNAGKSTLLNTLTNASVYAADQLFATLDPTTRRVTLPSNRQVLFSDTVGFIQKLPTTLIAAFRATLEEVAAADLLLHVVDASHHTALQQIETVEDTLAEIDVRPDVPRVLALNKADLLTDAYALAQFAEVQADYYATVMISAQKQTGLEALLQAIEGGLASKHCELHILLPFHRGDVLSKLYEHATVLSRQDTSQGVMLYIRISNTMYPQLKAFELKNPTTGG